MTLLYSLALNAKRFPEKSALVYEGEVVCYQSLYQRVLSFMSKLKYCGIGPGDKVAVLTENHPDLLVTVYAATGIGATPALINYRLSDREVIQVFENSESTAIFLGREWEHLAENREVHANAYFVSSDSVAEDNEHLIRLGDEEELTHDQVDISQSHSEIMCHTTGTTGLPKGVLRSNMGFEFRSTQYGVSADNSFLCVLPCCLSGGISFALWALYIGSTLHLHRTVDYDNILREISDQKINVIFLLSNMLCQAVDNQSFEEADLSTLTCLITGGGLIPKDVIESISGKCDDVLTLYYGSSELGPCASLSASEFTRGFTETCIGRPFFGVDLVLLDENGEEVPAGEIGKICVRSPMALDSYYQRDDLMEELIFGDYLTVGDMGRYDEQGLLHYVGRDRDFVKTGGINVSSIDIEAALLKHPGIKEVCCVGLPDRRWGEAICVVIVRYPDVELNEAEVIQFAVSQLAEFMKPRHVLFVEELPKNLSGRVPKPEVVEIAQTFLNRGFRA